ncbi:Metalloprotease TIKI2 [Schistosoma japonicum]|nr:Metalloprotease TIKI2 [Schistosoma japonicum]
MKGSFQESVPTGLKQSYQKTSKRKNTFLWKISTHPTSYLFGTLHVAYTHVWSQIDPAVKTSFAQSDIVYFELDLTNPVTLTELSNCQTLPKNQTITNLLKPDLIQRLDRYLNNFRHVISTWVEPEKKVYASYLYETLTKDWKEKRPIWLLLLLNSLTRSEISDRGVPVLDLFLAQEAQRLGKKHGAVEQVTFALEITLNNLENANHQTKYLTNTFNNVNNNDHANQSSSNDNKYPPNTKLLLNTWNDQMSQTFIINKQHKPIAHANLFNSPTDQLIEYYNCGDLNATLSKIYPTQTTLSDSVVPTSSFTTNTTVTTIDNNTAEQHKYSNKVNKNAKHHNYHTQSASIKSSYFVDKEITQFLNSSQIQILIDLENYLNEELIIKRNERMAREIISKLKLAESLNQSAFFALGAAHFLGSGETIIDHLRKAGYIILPVPHQNTMKNEDIKNKIAEKPLKFEKFNIISK